jgi:hypothetical protein
MSKIGIWSNLYVICFKVLLVILLSGQLYAEDIVKPINQAVINNGEIYQAQIESSKSDEELEKFVGKKINDVMYVIDFKRSMGTRIFEIFVTDPPQQNQKKDNAPSFLPSGFKYQFIKRNTQGDIETLEIDYNLPDFHVSWTPYYLLGALGSVVFIVLVFRKRILTFWTLKSLKRKKARELLGLLTAASERSDFETLLAQKKYFADLFHSDENLNKLFSMIQSIQYKRGWGEEELKALQKVKENILSLRSKIGI